MSASVRASDGQNPMSTPLKERKDEDFPFLLELLRKSMETTSAALQKGNLAEVGSPIKIV